MGQIDADMTASNGRRAYAGPLNRRQWAAFGVVFLLLPALIYGLARLSPASEKRLDLSLPWSLNVFHTQNAISFAQRVTEVTDGRVKITVHPGAVLGIKGPGSMRAVGDGMVAMADIAGFQQTGTEPILGLESLPFLVDDQDELKTLYDFLRPAVEAAYARHNLKLLYIVPWPNQNLFLDREVTTAAQMAGLKIRSQDKITTELMERLGLAPVQLPSPDVVPALASGAISATMTSTTTASAQKYWEFLRYIYRSNHIWVSNMMVMNMDVWNGLSAKDRQAIEALCRELEPQFWQVSHEDDVKQLQTLEEHGMKIVPLSPQLQNSLRAAARPMWRDFVRAQGRESQEILDRYLAATGRAPLDMTAGAS